MKYVIHSKSEKGFWHKSMGWVHSSDVATKYTVYMNTKIAMPASLCNDAELHIYEYDEPHNESVTN